MFKNLGPFLKWGLKPRLFLYLLLGRPCLRKVLKLYKHREGYLEGVNGGQKLRGLGAGPAQQHI